MGIGTQDGVEKALVIVLVVEHLVLRAHTLDRKSTSNMSACSIRERNFPFQGAGHQLPGGSRCAPQGWVLKGAIRAAVVEVIDWSGCVDRSQVNHITHIAGQPLVG